MILFTLTHDILNLFGGQTLGQTLVPACARNNSMYSDVAVSVLIFAFGIRSPLDEVSVQLNYMTNERRRPGQQ